jgi:ABC-type transporter Mla MlaB component
MFMLIGKHYEVSNSIAASRTRARRNGEKTAATEFSLPTVVRIDSKGFVLIAFNKKV